VLLLLLLLLLLLQQILFYARLLGDILGRMVPPAWQQVSPDTAPL
jgi:hypothetical protein